MLNTKILSQILNIMISKGDLTRNIITSQLESLFLNTFFPVNNSAPITISNFYNNVNSQIRVTFTDPRKKIICLTISLSF